MDFKKLTFGTWVTIGNASICELISSFDFDWVCFDLEHSSLNYTDLYSLIPIVEKNLKLPVVRVARNDEVEIKRALDAGAKAIIIPNIKDKHEAKQAVNYCKYKPMGIRGVGLSRAQGYGFKFKEYLKISNKNDLRYNDAGNVHMDFHGATNTTIEFIINKYGIETMNDIFKKVGNDVYKNILYSLLDINLYKNSHFSK